MQFCSNVPQNGLRAPERAQQINGMSYFLSRVSRFFSMKNAFTFELNLRIMKYEDVTPIPKSTNPPPASRLRRHEQVNSETTSP